MAENKSVAELREHGGELLCQCCKTGEPVFLTGEQGEAGVLLSREAYEARGGKPLRRPAAGRYPSPGALQERFLAAARQLEECAVFPERRRRRR